MKIQTTQKVWNPNFLEDLVEFLQLDFLKQDLNNLLDFINKKSPTTYEKLETLVDRIEFIFHLSVITEFVKKKKYILNNYELNGINWDIDALRLYLALTCVDILSINFEPFDKWLVKNCSDFDSGYQLSEYIKSKSDKYRNSFQLSSNFSRAFSKSSIKIREDICNNVQVINGAEATNDLGKIVSYLYRIRNKYTHEGRRFHSSPLRIDRNQNIGPRDEETLKIEAGFDLTDAILQIAKEQANREINKFAEQSLTL